MFPTADCLININLWNWKTLGFHPKPWKFFEKNLVKLLVKCNFIAFFVNPFAIFLKPSIGGRCHEVTYEGKNNVKIIKIYPSSASPTVQHLLPREGFKTLPSSYACHLPFQGRLIIGNFTVNLKIPWLCHGILLKVSLEPFQRLTEFETESQGLC